MKLYPCVRTSASQQEGHSTVTGWQTLREDTISASWTAALPHAAVPLASPQSCAGGDLVQSRCESGQEL